MKTLTEDTIRPFTGRHMALIMVAFFTVVVGVNVTMAVLARKSWTGLIVPNSYVASQLFNMETQKRNAMLAKGYRMQITAVAGRISIILRDRAGTGLPLRSVAMTLVRSDWAYKDVSLQLQCQSLVCSSKTELQAGQWRGEAVLDVANFGEWRQPVEVFVREN